MLKKIVIKNFISNRRGYLLYFTSNIIATMELFIFWGLKDIVLRAIKDQETALDFYIDFIVATGIISIITIMLMSFATIYYLKLRIKDYSLFIMLGLHRREVYQLILMEFGIGWIVSEGIGIIGGAGTLYGIQEILKRIYPTLVEVKKISFNVYLHTFELGGGIVLGTFLTTIIWLENQRLSSLMQQEEKNQKFPEKWYWSILIFIGGGLIVAAWFMFPSYEEIHYDAYFIWIVGTFLILIFGTGIVLSKIKYNKQKFYLKHLLGINQFSSKYQNNMMLVLMLFTIHFFALTYIMTGIVTTLFVEQYEVKNYPYDVIYMGNASDQKNMSFLSDNNVRINKIPMVRVTSFSRDQQIGISEKDYNNLTGRTLGLKNQEIVVEMEDQNNSNKIVTDKTFMENYSLMYVGRYSDDKSEELRSIAIGGKRAAKSKMAKNHTYKIKKMYTENTLGQYTTDRWRESLIIFSNDYFQKVHKSLSCDEQEPTELYLIKLKGKDKYKTWEKIKAYAQHRGMKIVNDGNERKIIYHTNSFVKEQKVRLMFELLSKIFILSILLASSTLVISIKNKADLKFYQKRFEFLRCMGMKEMERKKLQLIEIQSVNLVALIASLCMAVIHLIAYIMRAKKAGEINTVNFVKYWGCISMIYILFECVIQRVFAQHVLKEVEKQ